jgi:hypothetical protein
LGAATGAPPNVALQNPVSADSAAAGSPAQLNPNLAPQWNALARAGVQSTADPASQPARFLSDGLVPQGSLAAQFDASAANPDPQTERAAQPQPLGSVPDGSSDGSQAGQGKRMRASSNAPANGSGSASMSGDSTPSTSVPPSLVGALGSFSQQSSNRNSQPEFTPPPPDSSNIDKVPERVLEMVAICGPNGLEIRPGGYLFSQAQLEKRDGLFLAQLRAIVRHRREADASVFWEPRLRFLIEPGGEAIYREARKQTILAGTGWAITFQVAEPDALGRRNQEPR